MDNILISCAGGPAAIDAIKSLKQINFKGNIVTIDCDPLAVGGYLSDVNYIVPLSTSKNYWDEVLDIIIKEKITIIFVIVQRIDKLWKTLKYVMVVV